MVFAPFRDSSVPYSSLLEIIRRKAQRIDLISVTLGCPLNNWMQEMSPLHATFKERLNALLETWQEVIANALSRAQNQDPVRRDVNCRVAALFIVAAWEGCSGMAENLQSVKDLRLCVKRLEEYVAALGGTR